jgi:hypothetical protein
MSYFFIRHLPQERYQTFLAAPAGYVCQLFPHRLSGSFGLDALQQFFCWFVVRVLRNQLAAKGLVEQRGGKTFDLLTGGGVAGFEAVGEGEEGFDTADDFVLFGEVWKWETQCLSSFSFPRMANTSFVPTLSIMARLCGTKLPGLSFSSSVRVLARRTVRA